MLVQNEKNILFKNLEAVKNDKSPMAFICNCLYIMAKLYGQR